MSTQTHELKVEMRESGKHVSRLLRKNVRVPAVVYGSIDNMNLSLDARDVQKYNRRGFENTLFSLKSDDGKVGNVLAMMKKVTVHPLSRRPVHVDLFAIDVKKAVRVNLELRFEGKPAGLADGGMLSIVNRTIEIECLPTEIPDSPVVDVSHLGLNDSLHLSEVKLPEKIKLISSPDTTLAIISIVEEEKIEAPVVEAAAAAPAAGAAATPAAGAAAAPAAGAAGKAAPAAGKKEDKK